MSFIVDSHCHLNQIQLAENETLDSVLDQAREQGVRGFLSVATDVENAIENQQTQNHHADVWFSAGVHPLHPQKNDSWKDILQKLVLAPDYVAVGETGLDFHYATEKSHHDWQIEAFKYHCHLAHLSNKPLIVHTRQAKHETYQILKENPLADLPGVIHCFTEDLDAAKRFLDMGFYISFSGIISFKNSQDLRDVLSQIPLDRLLIETDSPYLAPIPHRGKANVPAYVIHVAQAIADVYKMPLKELYQITFNNFEKVFSVKVP